MGQTRPVTGELGEGGETVRPRPLDSSEPEGKAAPPGIARMAAMMPANVPATITPGDSPEGRQTTPAPMATAAATTSDALAAKESGGRTKSHSTSPMAASIARQRRRGTKADGVLRLVSVLPCRSAITFPRGPDFPLERWVVLRTDRRVIAHPPRAKVSLSTGQCLLLTGGGGRMRKARRYLVLV